MKQVDVNQLIITQLQKPVVNVEHNVLFALTKLDTVTLVFQDTIKLQAKPTVPNVLLIVLNVMTVPVVLLVA